MMKTKEGGMCGDKYLYSPKKKQYELLTKNRVSLYNFNRFLIYVYLVKSRLILYLRVTYPILNPN